MRRRRPQIRAKLALPEGTAMAITIDVARNAGRNQIMVSRTVNDWVAGSGIALTDCGEFALPSIGQNWHLYRVVT